MSQTEGMHALLSPVMSALAPLADRVPKDEDVTAGWVAFGIFIGMALAVVAIGFAMSRSFKRSKATYEAGGYGDKPPAPAPDDSASDA